MSNRHNTLTDEIFKNSKYIDMIQRHYGIKNFRKEYSSQYKILLDIFQTFILINNCFNSDSNLSLADKTDNARTIIEKLIYNDYENSQKHKYSVRDIKELCDKRARKLFNYMVEWQKELATITPKNVSSSLELKQMLEIIDKEMQELEEVGFDNIISDDISYQAKWLRYYKDYSIVISKFDTIYNKWDEFIEEYKKTYYENFGIELSEDDIEAIICVYDLVMRANNGLAKIISNLVIEDYNLDERSSAKDLYKAYLKSLKIDYQDIDTFEENSQVFRVGLLKLGAELNKKGFYSINEVIDNFDILSFLVDMENFIQCDDFKSKYNDINKIIDDLKLAYNTINDSKNSGKSMDEIDYIIENYYIPAYKIIRTIIERNKNYFVEVS